MRAFNPSHSIAALSFSNVKGGSHWTASPLAGKRFDLTDADNARVTYYIDVIPTLHVYGTRSVRSYELSVSERRVPVTYGPTFVQPGVFFKYELSPYIVVNEMEQRSLAHALASLAAVVGGVFVITGWVSALLTRLRRGTN